MEFFKFTPDLISEVELEKISVGRNELVQSYVDRIQNAMHNKSTSQILLLGPRGIGKSHTLLRIFHRLSNSNKVTAIRLAEEEYSISSLDDLCRRILEALNSAYYEENVTAYCRNELNKLKNDGKPVVLFVENLQMVFEQVRPDLGKLRSIIQSDQSLYMVGSALTYFDLITSPNEPFYKFFDITHLQGLTEKQVLELIKKRLEFSKKKHLTKHLERHAERIKGIHLLTGGNPRLIHILTEIVVQKNSLEDLERNLLSLLDQLTPFYQARMETLSGEQRRLFDAIALAEGPLSPTEIAKRLGISKPAIVVTQLRRLQKSGLVENVKFTNKKGTRYQIVERLYRIWRELRSTRGACKVKLFVDFIKLWYSKAELIDELEIASKKIDELYPHPEKKALSAAMEACHIPVAAPDVAVIRLFPTVGRLTLLNQFEPAHYKIQETKDLNSREKNPFLQKSVDILADLVEIEFLINPTATKYTVKQQSVMDKINALDKLKHVVSDESDRYKIHVICEKITRYLILNDRFEHALHYNNIAIDCIKNTHICNAVLNQRALIKRFLKQYDESLTIVDEILERDPGNSRALSEKVINLTLLKKQDLAVKTSKQLLAQDIEYFVTVVKSFSSFGLDRELLVLINQYKKPLLELKSSRRSQIMSGFVANLSNTLLHAIIVKNATKYEFCISILSSIKDMVRKENLVHGAGACAVTHIKEVNALQDLISILLEIFGSDKLKGLIPLIHALNYLAHNDPIVLEKLHPEMRQLVIQIIQEMSPHSKINKEIIDSVPV